MSHLPILYKKTSTGKIQYWKIFVLENPDHSTGYDIHTNYGQIDGKEQITIDSIFEGKNIGKANETTVQQQACREAVARWEKQKKKGYVENIEDAENGKVDDVIEGGIVPMLAHKFAEHGHKIEYPAFVQPKLDGIRCIAILKNGKCTLWTRTRKQITSMPHIVEELEKTFGLEDVVLDGELYNHDFKHDFEKIVSLVRQETPAAECHLVQYYVYDCANDEAFKDRIFYVEDSLKNCDHIFYVHTTLVSNETDVYFELEEHIKMGFEGVMVRNRISPYVNKRSYDLLKVKTFEDAEFDIVGIEEGRGKLMGCVGSFVCKIGDKTFLAKMEGKLESLKNMFEDHTLWQGKKLTVRYQGLTGKNGVPRFPVGVCIRDYE